LGIGVVTQPPAANAITAQKVAHLIFVKPVNMWVLLFMSLQEQHACQAENRAPRSILCDFAQHANDQDIWV
jgi:hypothetical protein